MQISNTIPEYDWSKIRELDFQEKYREKILLMKQLQYFQCTQCPDLIEHVSTSYFNVYISLLNH